MFFNSVYAFCFATNVLLKQTTLTFVSCRWHHRTSDRGRVDQSWSER